MTFVMSQSGSAVPLGSDRAGARTADADDTAHRDTVSLARRGDRAAQAALLRQWQDPWYRFCLSVLGDTEAAKDATQETAVRFLRQLRRFRGRSSMRTWSLGIALNVCREIRRRRPTVSLPQDDAGEMADPDTPAARAAKREQDDRLHRAVAALPDRQREAVALRYFEQLSVADTAAAMGCAEGTVKATISQALRSLRRAWSDEP
jgi:RNA polymerase sigma-70 factor (ECF subfamily)